MTAPPALEPRRHDPPAGWDREAFEKLTDAIAAALIAAVRRAAERKVTEAREERGR